MSELLDDFENWLEERFNSLIEREQADIIRRNAALLLNDTAWNAKVFKFEQAIETFEENLRDKIINRYVIHFDSHEFKGDGNIIMNNRRFPCQTSFDFSKFHGPVFFEETIFSFPVSFCSAEFMDQASFISIFNRESNFERATFKSARFTESVFLGDVSFRWANFRDEALFQNLTLENDVDFSDAGFGDEISFLGSNFVGQVSFYRARFRREAIFSDTQFKRSAKFSQAIFSQKASFWSAEFDGEANFSDAVFSEDLDFCKAKLRAEGLFIGVKFLRDANFEETRFMKEVNFSNAHFNGEVNCSGTNFWGGAYFHDVRIGEGAISFEGAEFGKFDNEGKLGDAFFTRLIVDGPANFSGTRFNMIPSFRDARFSRAPEVAGMSVPPPVLRYAQGQLLRVAASNDDVVRCRKLKAMALAAHDHEKDLEFFSYEMMAKRGVETTSTGGLLLNLAYDVLSKYGSSYVRPLGWMLLSFLVFGLLNVVLTGGHVAFAFVYSLKNAVPFVGTLARFVSLPEGYKSWYAETFDSVWKSGHAHIDVMAAAAIVQQIIGLVLLFLLLLALRNRFRMK